ncbi:response regulator [Deltaproteobacteria bacterium]|nr:response regulator [Deltaproteobacteria bacterium]
MPAEKDLKILVVDDFSATRTIVINHLRKLGYSNTVEAENGFSALATLKSALFDLVVTDWNMSDMSGLDLLKLIRADSDLKNIPVLMVTSEDLQGNIITAIKAGLNDYIVRPFEEYTFKQKLEKIFV